MNTNKLREEWDEYLKTDSGKYTTIDWWINKLSEQEAHHQEELERIAKNLESWKGNEGDVSDKIWAHRRITNSVIDDAASLVRSKIKV